MQGRRRDTATHVRDELERDQDDAEEEEIQHVVVLDVVELRHLDLLAEADQDQQNEDLRGASPVDRGPNGPKLDKETSPSNTEPHVVDREHRARAVGPKSI